MMKKLLCVVLSVLLLVGMLAGCGGKDSSSGKKDNGKTTLTIGIPMNTAVIDYETNTFTQWLEEELDCNIEIQLFATGANDYMTQLSGMMLKGDKLPDLIWNFDGMKGGTWDLYGQDGYLIDLKPYMDDKEGASKVWWDAVADVDPEQIQNALRRCEDDFGAMYVFPRIETSMIDTMDYMVSVNKTWLDECGLKQPTNTEELYQVLKTFKEKKCGDKAGYYPLIGGGDSLLSGDVINWLINMFVYFDDATYFNLSEDGKTLTAPFTSDKYREALAFCKKLVDEGLLMHGIDMQEIKSLLNPADGEPRVGMVVGHPTLSFLSNDASIDHFVPLENYWGYAVRKEGSITLSTGISADCEDPDLAFKLLMLVSSQEGAYRLRYGEKGVDWDWADKDAVSYMGLPCTVKVFSETLSTSTQNKTWKNGPGVLINSENETAQYPNIDGWIGKRCDLISGIYDSFCVAEEKNNPKNICPTIVLSEKQSQENEVERTNTQNVVYIMRDTFIRGTSSDTILNGANADINNDAHWQKYLDALNSEGLDVWQKQIQAIYDESYAK